MVLFPSLFARKKTYLSVCNSRFLVYIKVTNQITAFSELTLLFKKFFSNLKSYSNFLFRLKMSYILVFFKKDSTIYIQDDTQNKIKEGKKACIRDEESGKWKSNGEVIYR